MFCDECGSEIEDGSLFCEQCGASLAEGEPTPARGALSTPPPVPPGTESMAPPPPAPPGGQPGAQWGAAPQPAAPPAGKGKLLPVLVTLGVLLVVGVVAVVLMLTVFKEKDTGKKEEDSTPAPSATAEAYLKALEGGDLDALLDLIDPAFIEDLKGEYGKEYKSILKGYFLDPLPEGVKFSGLEFSEEVNGDRAEISLVKGEVTYRDESGKKVTEDLAGALDDTLGLVRRNGVWYLDMESFEEFQGYLADYEGGGGSKDDGGGKGGKGTKTFESTQIGISFAYPQEWVVKEYPEGVVEVAPAGAEDKAKVSFYTEDLTGVEYTLEDWVASETGELDAQGWPYEVVDTKVAGNPAAQITFSYLGEQSYGYKVMDTIFISGDTAYIVSYIALEEVFDGYLDAARGMIKSLRLLAKS